MTAKEDMLRAAKEAICQADEDSAMEIIDESLSHGYDLLELLRDGFVAGNAAVGDSFEKGELSLPELIYSTEVMKSVTERIMSSLEGYSEKKGRILIATVEGDAHDIGKNIVTSTLRASGFEVIDLGRDVPVEDIIKMAEKYDVDIIGTSALLTTTLEGQKKLEIMLRKLGLRDKYMTMVGGAPCTPRWAKRIGADVYSEDAIDAVKKATELLENKSKRSERDQGKIWQN